MEVRSGTSGKQGPGMFLCSYFSSTGINSWHLQSYKTEWLNEVMICKYDSLHMEPLVKMSQEQCKHIHGCCCCFSRSVVFDSLRPHGLLPTRLLCPWTSPGQSTGVGCHFLLQGIFLTRDWTCVSCTGREILHHWATRKATSMVPRLRKHFLCTLSSKLYFSLSFIMLSIRCQNA